MTTPGVNAVLLVDESTVLVERVDDPLAWAKRVRPELKWFDSFLAGLRDDDQDCGAGVMVWVDDMGVFQGFPVNERATALLRPFHPLVGPVLITGPADEAGDLTDVPDFVIARVRTNV